MPSAATLVTDGIKIVRFAFPFDAARCHLESLLYRVFEKRRGGAARSLLFAVQNRGQQFTSSDEHVEASFHEVGLHGNGVAKLHGAVIAGIVTRPRRAAGRRGSAGAGEFNQVVTGVAGVIRGRAARSSSACRAIGRRHRGSRRSRRQDQRREENEGALSRRCNQRSSGTWERASNGSRPARAQVK